VREDKTKELTRWTTCQAEVVQAITGFRGSLLQWSNCGHGNHVDEAMEQIEQLVSRRHSGSAELPSETVYTDA
jgi:hypothetical protein